jgi:phosphoglycerate dehydrogenase-like enzyme
MVHRQKANAEQSMAATAPVNQDGSSGEAQPATVPAAPGEPPPAPQTKTGGLSQTGKLTRELLVVRPSRTPGSRPPPVVLFAVNAATKSKFLPGFDVKQLPPFREEWLNFDGLTPEKWERLLFTLEPEVIVTSWESPAIPTSILRGNALPLRYVCHLTGGVKGIVSRDLIERGLLVSNWGGAISHTIAEHALLLTLGCLRGVPLWRPHMLESPNSPAKAAIPTRSLFGRKVGIHGFGAIVRHLLALLQPFNVSISSYSAGVPEQLMRDHGVHPCQSLDELAANHDIFIELEALTPQSRGTVDARILNLLPTNTVFINVGRGAVVDEVALAELAARGKILVGADVFVQEPLPLDSLLLKAPGALLSPHIAGPTQDALPLCGGVAMANLHRYLSGRVDEIEGRVTLEIFDRTT